MDFGMQRSAPSFSRKAHRQVFITMAAAEMALLCILILVFVRYHLTFDPIHISAALLVALAAGSWMVRRSVALAQMVFFFALAGLELFLLLDPPFKTLALLDIVTVNTDWLPPFFILLDIVVLWYFLVRAADMEDEENESVSVQMAAERFRRREGMGSD
jgi:hypothetical protein